MTSERHFNKLVPIEGSDLDSQPIRDNFYALAVDNAGPNPPDDPEEGYTWLDTSLSTTPVIKVYWGAQWYGLFQYSVALGKFVATGTAVAWGSITGTIADQADLKAALDAKLPLTPESITIIKATANPGGDNTLWINLTSGHLYRGSVDLEMILGKVTVENSGGQVAVTDNIKFTGNVNVSGDASQVTVNVLSGVAGNYIQNENAVGTKDGVNDTFTVPGSISYASDTLIVYLNGMAYRPESIVELAPGFTQFQIFGDNIPQSDDTLTVSFFEA